MTTISQRLVPEQSGCRTRQTGTERRRRSRQRPGTLDQGFLVLQCAGGPGPKWHRPQGFQRGTQNFCFPNGTYIIPLPGQTACGAAGLPVAGSGNPASFSCQFSLVGKPSDTQYTATYNRPFRADKISYPSACSGTTRPRRNRIKWARETACRSRKYSARALSAGVLCFHRAKGASS